MKKAFYKLNESKQKIIINACIYTFAKYGYDRSTTDKIINKAGISKGSLYGYAQSKESIYMFIVEYVYNQLYDFITHSLEDFSQNLPNDILKRLEIVYKLVFDYYFENPLHVQLLANNYFVTTEKLKVKITKIYTEKFITIFGDIDDSNLLYDRKTIYDIIAWLLIKIRLEFLEDLKHTKDVDILRENCFHKWNKYIKILENGIYKTD